MAIIFDPANKRIILDVASVSAAEIWSRWVDWVKLSDNAKYSPAMGQLGGDDLGSGIAIPPYLFLLNDWRVRPMESNHTLIITGNLFVQGGGVPVVPTLGNFNVSTQYTVPVQAQALASDKASIAEAVWQHSVSVTMAIKLAEVWGRLGLDPSKPLQTGTAEISFGTIVMAITEATNLVTITRQ